MDETRPKSNVRRVRRFDLLPQASRVMNVLTRAARGKENRMATFTIDADNNITAYLTPELAATEARGETAFGSQAAFGKLSREWPLERLAEIWNGIPGQKPIKKFAERDKAVAQIWRAIQTLASAPEETSASKAPGHKPKGRAANKVSKKKAKTPEKRSGKAAPKQSIPSERSNKKAAVLAMMQDPKGATLAEIMAHTGWQAHTVRGFISILGSKGGVKVESSKNVAGERTYRSS